MDRPEYCLAISEDLPCACGATASGKDPVHGVCQARTNRPRPEPLLEFVLVHKDTNEIAARQTVLVR